MSDPRCSRKPWCEKRDKHVGACYPFHNPVVTMEHRETKRVEVAPEDVPAFEAGGWAEVIPFTPREPSYDGKVCAACGEAWFEVRAIVLSKDGSPTGYAGVPKCVACGREAS